MSPEDKLVGLLQLALQQGADCKSFCVHPCAAAVDAELAWLLLHFAVVTEQHRNLQALLLLPAAVKLSAEKITELVMVALQGAEGTASLATLSKAAAAECSAPAGSDSSSSSEIAHTAPKQTKQQQQQQYTFRNLSAPAAAVAPTAAAALGPGVAGSSGEAAASNGSAAAAATAAGEGPFSGGAGEAEGNKDSVPQPMQSLSLSGNAASAKAAASSACLAVLCQWDAAAAIGADGLLQLLQAAAARAVTWMTQRASTKPASVPDHSAVQQLSSSKAASGISSAPDLKPLLQLVLKLSDHVSAEALLGHCPAAAAIDAAMLGELLQHTLSDSGRLGAAAGQQESEVRLDVLEWPAAAAKACGLSTEQQEELQHAAAALAAAGLLQMQPGDVAAMELSPELLQELLIQACVQHDAALAAALCKCQAAAELSSDAVKLALTTAAAAAALRSREVEQKAAAASGQGAAAGSLSGAGVSEAAGAAAAAGMKQGGKGGRRCKKARKHGKK